MTFDRKDIEKFYTLLNHYNILSPNIGITGSRIKFNNFVKEEIRLLKKKPDVIVKLNEDKTKLTIIEDDIERTYIYVDDDSKLTNQYFKKFL